MLIEFFSVHLRQITNNRTPSLCRPEIHSITAMHSTTWITSVSTEYSDWRHFCFWNGEIFGLDCSICLDLYELGCCLSCPKYGTSRWFDDRMNKTKSTKSFLQRSKQIYILLVYFDQIIRINATWRMKEEHIRSVFTILKENVTKLCATMTFHFGEMSMFMNWTILIHDISYWYCDCCQNSGAERLKLA